MRDSELIAPVNATEASYFLGRPPLTADEDQWRRAADQAVAQAASVEAWQQALQVKAVDALVHGKFRQASFFFHDYEPAQSTQAECSPDSVGQGGTVLKVLGSLTHDAKALTFDRNFSK